MKRLHLPLIVASLCGLLLGQLTSSAWAGPPTSRVIVPPPSVPPSVPSAYQSTYSALSSVIANIPTQDSAGSVLPNQSATIMAAELETADGGYGPALLASGYLGTVTDELSNLQQMGVSAVVVNVAFPLLLPSFPDSSQYLAFYEQVTSAAHKDGIAIEIEQNPIIPSLSSVSVSSFYASLTNSSYAADQQQQAQIEINDLQPQFIDLVDEVDTFTTDLGLSFGTPSGLSSVLAQELSGLTKISTKIGAGIGAWESTSLESAIAAVSGIDYLSVHFYPQGTLYTSQMDTMNQVTTIAAQANLPLFFDETWDNKAAAASPPPTGASDQLKLGTFNFWEPLDSQYLAAITGYARAHHFSLISPFDSNEMFTYLTWTPTLDAEKDTQVIDAEIKQVQTVLPGGTITTVGQTFMALSQSATPSPLSVTSSTLPTTASGATYSTNLQASGGIPPYSWSAAAGQVPAGLALASDGVLSGIAPVMGSYPMSVLVSDSSVPAHTTSATVNLPVVHATSPGYWMLASSGAVYPFGSAQQYGPTGAIAATAAALAATPDGMGYWLVTSSGKEYNFGDAPLLQSTTTNLTAAVAIASSSDGNGTWVATSGGQILAAGDASDLGSPSESGLKLSAPIVNMVPTPDGGGYWLLGADGGVFTYGDASFYGSTGSIHLNMPAVAMFPTETGAGYWFVASDGGIFTFGDAGYFGSMGGKPLDKPVNGMVATPDGRGYWLVASDGGVFTFGDAGFVGSLGGQAIPAPIVGFAAI